MSAVFEITRNFQLMFWDCHRGCEFPSRTRCSQVAVLSLSSPNRVDTGQVGRPKFDIKEETLVELHSLGFSWEDIARMLLVSRWTIHRRVSEFGLNHLSRFSDITDEQLDNKVGAFLREHGCLVGTSMILGHLRSEGLIIQRERVRKCLARIDPHNVRIRRAITVSRRAYSVAGPNSLWHLDGHHSLITWGFVIHGSIDGFSRLITFLHCSTNNRSDTVGDLFLNATQAYGWPSRVRTDHGGENTQVWQVMEDRRGPNRGSFLVGSSTHNQRIKRLWRDVFRCVAHIFYYTFQAMEESGLLEIDNPLHKFALHFIYLPRINRALSSFASAWNNHPLRTENNWSPKRIWVNGMIDFRNHQLMAVADMMEQEPSFDDLTWYGYDPSAPTPMDDGLALVDVQDVDIELPANVLHDLTAAVNPVQLSNRYGIDLFIDCLNYLQSHV
ncbi:hypothetical protein OS493_012903 [Desmophyllum pertusum]|uniref:Integrase catalytic domain-containing protein n=1 Tax=Desmophyllum pertusum TaxID=174260 RepID=A0A9W9Z1F8_9CNID|nr:hypothetical protein OS493_012903 [Desmophyllum pertusum]